MALSDPRFGFDPVAAFLGRPLDEVIGEQVGLREEIRCPAPRSVAGLRQLASEYAWLAVLQLATSLLAEHDGNEHNVTNMEGGCSPAFMPHMRLLCVAYRCLALVQTRQFASAQHAIAQLGNVTPENLEYRYETYPHLYPPDKYSPGSFVPFELKFLALEIRIHQGDASAIADAYELSRDTSKDVNGNDALSSGQKQFFRSVLLSAIACYHLIAQQHDAAADVSRELVKLQGQTGLALYMYFRTLLQIGDLRGAIKVLRRAEKCQDCSPALHHLHSGMLLAARGCFEEALVEYDASLNSEREEQYLTSPQNLWVCATNNAAVCLMHCGRLIEAVGRIEDALRRRPELALDEGLTLNLAVMYDLAYPQNSRDRKFMLQTLATRIGRQGFDLSKIAVHEAKIEAKIAVHEARR